MIAVLPSRFRTKVARDSRIPMTPETFCRFRVRTALTLPPTKTQRKRSKRKGRNAPAWSR